MKIYLDDTRKEPAGWTRCYWPEEVIELLKNNDVTAISLDHDLGDDARGTGYDVLQWIEEQVHTTGYMPPNVIIVHSANPAASQRMREATDSIRLAQKKRTESLPNQKLKKTGLNLRDYQKEGLLLVEERIRQRAARNVRALFGTVGRL